MASIAAERTRPAEHLEVRAHKRKIGPIVLRILFWILVAFILVYTVFPFYWAILASVRPASDLASVSQIYWPSQITWEHWEYVFDNDDFLRALANSAIVSLSTVIVALIFGSFAAYAIGRMHFRGRIPIMYIILSMTMFPAIAILGSLFQMVRTFDLYNTMQGLVITYLTFTLPFTVWVLANFFRAMPRDLR